MNWKNVKRVIIVLLIIANVVAAGSFFGEFYSRRQISDSALQSCVEILSDSQIEISKDTIYRRLLDCPVYAYETNVPYSLEFSQNYKTEYTHFANMVSHLTKGYSVTESFIDTPDGISIYMTSDAFSANLNIENDGSISYFSQEEQGVSSASYEEKKVSKENARAIKAFFESIYGFFGAKESYGLLYEYEQGEKSHVVCVQKLSGYEYPEKTIDFCIKDGRIVSFSGSWCFDFKKAYSSKLYDAVNALFKVRDSAKSIESIVPVYCSVPYNEDETFAIPSFCIVFTDKEGKRHSHIYDALTLELRAEPDA